MSRAKRARGDHEEEPLTIYEHTFSSTTIVNIGWR